MRAEILKWLADAPFGDDMYFVVSLDTLQKFEEMGVHVVTEKMNYCSQPEKLEPSGSLTTIAGKRLYVNSASPDNEVRLFNSFGLQAVFLLRPESRDLRAPMANHISWPSPLMNT